MTVDGTSREHRKSRNLTVHVAADDGQSVDPGGRVFSERVDEVRFQLGGKSCRIHGVDALDILWLLNSSTPHIQPLTHRLCFMRREPYLLPPRQPGTVLDARPRCLGKNRVSIRPSAGIG